MSAFENAKQFFAACEAPAGWAGCREYVADGATFTAQSEPVAEINSIKDYCEWMKAFGTVTAAGASYELHTSAWDETTRNATFFATYNATHTGEGGPVPPTGKSTLSHYVYIVTMDESDKVSAMTKVWNAPWAMKELGWT